MKPSEPLDDHGFTGAYMRGLQEGKDDMLTDIIELVNCRYEQATDMYILDEEDMSYGEAMALRDILFELDEL